MNFSFQKWVSYNIKRRLIVAAVFLSSILAVLQVGVVVYARNERFSQFSAFGELVADAVRNSDLSFIQSTSLLMLDNLDGKWVMLTDANKKKRIWSYPEGRYQENSIFFTELAFPIDSIRGKLFLVASVPILPNYTVTIAPITCSILLFIMILYWAISGTISQLANHLSRELKKITSGEDRIFIRELEDVREKILRMRRKEREQSKGLSQKSRMEAIGKVTAQVAHDIRSPLSSMQAALGYFSGIGLNDPKSAEALNLLELSAKRLTGIADDLLRKHKGDEQTKVIFSLHKVLDELVGEYQSQEAFKEVAFIKNYPSQSIELYGIPENLQRAFGNLIKNGIEAMEMKGSITISTEVKKAMVRVGVKDTGAGISEETLKKILKGGYTEGKKEGHGIGLTVVRETVEDYKGKLSAVSEVGKGTTFYVELTLPTEEEKIGVSREERAIGSFTLKTFKEEPVVIVDDEASMREQWRFVLTDNRREAIVCNSYEDVEGQEITSDRTKTAVVDYHFENSEKNGGEVIELLQKRGFVNLYLCTAEYWKPSVQKLAQKLKVTICPKPLPKIIVQSLGEQKREDIYNIVVIDDDPLMKITWKALKDKMQIKDFYFYGRLEDLIEDQKSAMPDLASLDFAFVDKNIEGSNYSLIETTNYLKTNGVKKVLLATGENVNKNDFPGIDHVVGNKIPESLEIFI